MESKVLLAAIATTLFGAACAGAQHHGGADAPHQPLIDRQGQRIGTAVFQQTPNGLLISVTAEGLPPGEHGFHIHETGTCDPATGFSSAGGHFAPAANPHGFEVEGGPHAGDMANQFVGPDGKLRAHVFNPRVTLGEASLTDSDGSALVIHAGADDYHSQPSGDAGDRIACAVIAPPRG